MSGKKKLHIRKIIVGFMFIASILSIRTVAINAQNNDFTIDRNGVLRKYNGIGGEVKIPDKVKIIGEKAFSGNTNVTSVVLPNSVIKIEASAFDSCTGLKK